MAGLQRLFSGARETPPMPTGNPVPAVAALALLVTACGGGQAATQSAPPTAAAPAVATALPAVAMAPPVAGASVAPSPAAGTTRIEAEGLAGRTTTPNLVGPAPDCCGVHWSSGSELWFRANTPGQSVDLLFTVPRAGTYRLDAGVTQAPDYGIVTLALGGQPQATGFDAYVPGVVGATVRIAPVTVVSSASLTAGAHTLTVAVTGRNPASTGFFAGIDYLDLVPV